MELFQKLLEGILHPALHSIDSTKSNKLSVGTRRAG
jgi:hypothetical protein